MPVEAPPPRQLGEMKSILPRPVPPPPKIIHRGSVGSLNSRGSRYSYANVPETVHEGASPEPEEDESEYESDEELPLGEVPPSTTTSTLTDRPWQYLTSNFPWACFLSEGAFKRVYKVYNDSIGVEEAVSVM